MIRCPGSGLAILLLSACLAAPAAPRDRIPADGPWTSGVVLPQSPQAPGDPDLGRDILLNGDFMTCGLPYRMWEFPISRGFIAGGFGGSEKADTLPGRHGKNTDMPYYLNAFTAPNGAEVINANCLMCHGGEFDGQLVIGLPNATADFTSNSDAVGTVEPDEDLWDLLGLDAAEIEQAEKMFDRARVLAPLATMRTVGMNPAEMYAIILMSHHDRDTLAWRDEPVTPIVVRDHDGSVIEDPIFTSDPAPWWRAGKKSALFYNGMARGDHRGTMALASSVCVDSIERARVVDGMFAHIQAFIRTIEPPTYPRSIDRSRARRGEDVFLANCAGCHGTYDPDHPDREWYPNLLIPLDVIGTDPVIAEGGVVHSPELVEWYNASFYGQITQMKPDDPFPGYMPPPLDGIWATAPYFHNGSVPTIEAVLNSGIRPDVWRRVDLDSTNFDEDAIGWPYETLTIRQADAPPADRKFIYDTGYWSQSNSGHTFGDHLSDSERRDLLEYLKTL